VGRIAQRLPGYGFDGCRVSQTTRTMSLSVGAKGVTWSGGGGKRAHYHSES